MAGEPLQITPFTTFTTGVGYGHCAFDLANVNKPNRLMTVYCIFFS
jgi:hypothetical protein